MSSGGRYATQQASSLDMSARRFAEQHRFHWLALATGPDGKSTALEGKTMAKRPTNRIKYKLWDPNSTMEYDGTIDEGIYYAAWSLSLEDRKVLIGKLVEQQASATAKAESAPSS
ncbi:hypothetical protein [Pseudomonas putida]|uniref:hypothetical protein n=1 Tax=Pseudomonas putida TaxID=303 RepID=UPI002AC7C4FC|nr:hypothetical protein [Pseudomonas putida]MDZ5111912.1 hypothetical protein [Pseudomonas putida]